MAVILVNLKDTFDQWRTKTNNISIGLGDFVNLHSDDSSVVRAVNTNWTNIGTLSALTTTLKDNLVDAVNEVDAHTDVNTISIGVLGDLDTDDKSSLVNAINEVYGDVGDTASLTTDEKGSLVGAVNEVDAHTDTNTTNIGDVGSLINGPTLVDAIEANIARIDDVWNTIGDPNNFPYGIVIEDNLIGLDTDLAIVETILGNDVLLTTAVYVTGAVNELFASTSTIGDLGDLTTSEQTTIVAAVNEINATVNGMDASLGDLSTLETGDQSSLVAAINEVATNTIVMALILG